MNIRNLQIKMSGINKFNNHSETLVFKFKNKETANAFKVWMCEGGEQDYWTWMEAAQERSEENITVSNFNYHTGTDEIIATNKEE